MGNCVGNTSTITISTSSSKKQPSKENKNSGTRRSHELESKKVVPESGHEARGANPSPKSVEDFRRMAPYSNANSFTYDELRRATGNFRSDQVIGRGGFGVVYKGVLDDDVRQGLQHTPVAIKVLDQDGSQGDREWLAEVNHLGQVVHQNLVKLIGYCCEEEHRLLVYEYMASGSLEKHLFRRVSLTMPWPTRIKIAFDAAKGLAFLHGAERPVIYRDFKPSNILLDEDFNAKLSDFGLAKEGPVGDQTHVTTRVMGTQGYAAPEYIMTGHLTSRSDVYGFGVVLLEILLGRSTAKGKCRSSRGHNLVEWVRPLLIHYKKLLQIVDPRIEGQYTIKTMKKVAKLAYRCLDQNPRGRPTMSQVVEILEAIRNLSECRGGSVLFHSGDGIVTLYEVPQDTWDRTTKEGKCSSKVEDDTEPEVEKSKRKASKAQSRSGRPSIEYGKQKCKTGKPT